MPTSGASSCHVTSLPLTVLLVLIQRLRFGTCPDIGLAFEPVWVFRLWVRGNPGLLRVHVFRVLGLGSVLPWGLILK